MSQREILGSGDCEDRSDGLEAQRWCESFVEIEPRDLGVARRAEPGFVATVTLDLENPRVANRLASGGKLLQDPRPMKCVRGELLVDRLNPPLGVRAIDGLVEVSRLVSWAAGLGE
jgi:hypothetical protein